MICSIDWDFADEWISAKGEDAFTVACARALKARLRDETIVADRTGVDGMTRLRMAHAKYRQTRIYFEGHEADSLGSSTTSPLETRLCGNWTNVIVPTMFQGLMREPLSCPGYPVPFR